MSEHYFDCWCREERRLQKKDSEARALFNIMVELRRPDEIGVALVMMVRKFAETFIRSML